MKTSTKYVIAGLAIAVTAGAAFAANGYRHHGDRARMAMEMFNKTDKDGDKAISLDEMMAALTERFGKADADGDKSVTKAEVIAAVENNPDMPRARRWSGRIADNVVYRLGLADSRAQARQLVAHGHIMLNDRKTTIPSAMVKAGDKISIRPESNRRAYFRARREEIDDRRVPRWLSLDGTDLSAKVLNLPTREDIDVSLNEQLIVEYYSR